MTSSTFLHRARVRWSAWVWGLVLMESAGVVVGAVLFWWRYRISPSVALHYNVLLGTDSIGPWWHVFLLPAVSIVSALCVVAVRRQAPQSLLVSTALLCAWGTNTLLILGVLFAFVASAAS